MENESLIPLINIDIIEPNNSGEYVYNDNQNFQSLLKSQNKVVLFAVPGAFTPTCTEKHLPGFIANAHAMYAKGVDAIYCIAVNDKYVMKAWGLSTLDFTKSGIKLVADGNCELTNAMNSRRDYSDYRLGLRSARYAVIAEKGIIKYMITDEGDLENSSAEKILNLL